MKRILTLVLVSLTFFNLNLNAKKSALSIPERTATAYKDYNVAREVVYKNRNGNDLGLDIIMPEKQLYKNGSPVIIHIHGGGWGGGERYILGPAVIKRYSDLGIALVPISYTLREGVDVCVTDCFDAARFLAKNAKKYNLDMSRVGVSGHSAGGHLCLMLTVAPEELFPGDESLKDGKFTVLCGSAKAPITTLIDDEILNKYPRAMHRAASGKNLGLPFDQSYEKRKWLSPLEYITKTSPKVQIIHGDKDTACPIEETVKAVAYAKKVGNEIDFIEVVGSSHGGVVKSNPEEEQAFYVKHLLKDIEKL